MATYHIQALDDLLTTFGMEMAESARDLTARIDEVQAALAELPPGASGEQIAAVLTASEGKAA